MIKEISRRSEPEAASSGSADFPQTGRFSAVFSSRFHSILPNFGELLSARPPPSPPSSCQGLSRSLLPQAPATSPGFIIGLNRNHPGFAISPLWTLHVGPSHPPKSIHTCTASSHRPAILLPGLRGGHSPPDTDPSPGVFAFRRAPLSGGSVS